MSRIPQVQNPAETKRHASLDYTSLELVQASLDAGGCIRRLNEAGREAFSPLGRNLKGRSFLQLLRALNPGWDSLLPESFATLERGGCFLPWGDAEQPGLGWRMEMLPVGDDPAEGLLVSLVPGLAPDIAAQASEDGLADRVGPTLHNLFFRTRQVEARFREFLRLLPGVPYAQDINLRFAYRNAQLRSLVGEAHFGRLEAGEIWTEWIHPEDREPFRKNLASCISSRAPVGIRFRLQLPGDDRILYILDLRIPVRSLDGQITGYEGLWLDLTRQTLAEKRLQLAAWKESLAEITGSLSHDFNNVITGIVNLADLMFKSNQIDRVTFRYDVKIIRESARQAQQLIQRIIALNREHAGEIKLHNLVEIVSQQQDLIRIVLPRHLKISVDLPEREIPVQVDQSAIRRILLNFATNARDAIDYQGEVQIALRVVDLHDYPRDHLLSSRCGTEGEAAELVFRDNGCGIDPKILHRIFDPYFSTKQASRGSGLGLYSMTQFAHENGFDFGVRSTVGKGTEMFLLIPVERLDLAPVAETRARRHRLRARRRRAGMQVALYGEFNEPVVNLTRELIGNGINVHHFEEVEPACLWLREHATPEDVFLMFMDHRKAFPDPLRESLGEAPGRARRLLFVRGFNPDEISHLKGSCIDEIFEEHGHPKENLRAILPLTVPDETSGTPGHPA